ncbi:MAG TPA: glycosyl hydrolase family 28-related protein [Oscillospiraceae bacterium]|nr:glycosyl hydrolase family 28-related protein [Oscillospiraceae bacterium]HPF56681.1 glycosyl hydrolase family 28-related protein [Clostridiales bacterium]HPK34316.1 glycosyl hydrolase family 28-related protein [Oscillospiraceae bacterium]HPR75095.1 glycosyl hydrolase family 28-related protein [Oscillospiraceae bacterium]
MKNEKVLGIKTLGAKGDGLSDDTAAIQLALDRAEVIEIPDGNYRITSTLKVPSHTAIRASAKARLFLCGETPKKRGDFLLSNDNPESGNNEISISGGIWDGNNAGRCNVKAGLYDPNGYSGTVLNFSNIRGLILRDMTITNSAAFYVRFNRLDGFDISSIRFSSDELRPNQDGLHFGGNVRNGRIKDITALSNGQTNDDMIAFNADDSMERVENLDMSRGPIENITVENVSAENCYTFFRLLSITSPIRNIRIKDISGGCRVYAVNMDAARYCLTPLFKENDYPDGVGEIENIEIEDMRIWHTGNSKVNALLLCESMVKDFKITGFSRITEFDTDREIPTLLVRNVTSSTVAVQGKEQVSVSLKNKSEVLKWNKEFTELKIN